MPDDTLNKLAEILASRKNATPESSYVASLYAQGTDAILKKIGEEATELILAAKSDNADAIIHETADLWFHSLVMLAQKNLAPTEVLKELDRRLNISGLTEKSHRQK